MKNSRVENAIQNFKDGYNCSQSVVKAYCDLVDLSETDALRMAEGFGGGMGRLRLTCGAVSGMAMIAGAKFSKAIPKDTKTRSEIYDVIQKMSHEFEEKNGSIICGELLGASKPKDNSPTPEKRTDEYYKKRPCIKCVGDCAEIVEKYLFS